MQLLQRQNEGGTPKAFNEYLVVQNTTFGGRNVIVFPGCAGLLSDSDVCFVKHG